MQNSFPIRGFVAAAALFASTTTLHADGDPLASGRVLEFSLGGTWDMSEIQDQLLTPNSVGMGPFPAGPTLLSTDIFSDELGGRVEIGFGDTLANGMRIFANVSSNRLFSDAAFTSPGGTFPGSYDDGLQLPAGGEYDLFIEDRHTNLVLGADLISEGALTFGLGVQAAWLEQEAGFGIENFFTGTGQINSRNQMMGIMARVGHYTAFGDAIGLRLNAQFGLLANNYDYSYTYTEASVLQNVSASGTTTATHVGLSAQLERALSENTLLTAEIGYEGFYHVINGFDTFLDRLGTRTAANIDPSMIGSGYLNIGLVRRF